ncbi:MAG: MaoC family dehydratase N-terminal domain-containing protein [Halieaceae bacterium]|nr:MaoC family dehydratase N-terminal domain-containing protein [Halieaceae bacterium]
MTVITEKQFEEWRGAVGRQHVRSQYLDPQSASRYAVAAGLSPDAISALVHWAWFLEAVPDTGIGPDGHPKRGVFLPDISLPRRMFASSKIEFHQPLVLERQADISIEIADLYRKSGSQGELVFAKVARTITQQDTLAVREIQTLVYRGEGDPVPLPVDKSPAGEQGDEVWTPSTVKLFRFSSVTFNSHRIHYDQQYAREVEGYPDLVVHGPYTATKLADFAARRGELASFEFRGKAPLYQGQRVLLRQIDDETVQALRCDSAVAVEAKVRYR